MWGGEDPVRPQRAEDGAGLAGRVPLRAAPLPTPLAPPHLDLADVVGGDEDADANGDEDEADDEEGREHRASRQDGLPSRQALLFEGRVIRPPVLRGAPRGARGPAVHFILRVIAHRHGPPGRGSAGRRCSAQGIGLLTLAVDAQAPLRPPV